MRGVTTKGTGWASGEGSDLVEFPTKSSTIHAFENIRVYVEHSHFQFRVYGLDDGLRHVEEFQVLTEVLFVH
jgi:hypothetical protein